MARSALPQNYIRDSGTLIEDFEDSASFPVTVGTVANSTDYYRTGTKSLKIVTTAGAAGYADKAVNLRPNQSVELWVYIEDSSKINYITLLAGKDGMYAGWVNYYSVSSSLNPYGPLNGWNCFRWNLNQFFKNGTVTWSEVAKIRVRVTPMTGQIATVYFDCLRSDRLAHPKILFQFDNGIDGQYDYAYPILAAAGIRGTIGVVSDFVDDVGYCTTSELQEMYAAGWAMANHSKSHRNMNAATLPTVAEQYDAIDQCSMWLEENGMPRAARHFIYPSGIFDQGISFPALTQAGILTARGTYEDMHVWPENTVRNRMYAYQMTTTRGTAAVKAEIDRCVAAGDTLFLYTHVVKPEGEATLLEIDTAYLQEIVDYVITKRATCQTIDEWYNGLTNPRYRSLPPTR